MFKKLTFVFLAVLLFGGSVLAFAWWDNLDENEAGTLELGYGVRLALDNQTTAEQGILVPENSFFAADEDKYTTSYVFTYELTLPDVTEGLDVLIDITNLKVGEAAFTSEDFKALDFQVSTNEGTFVSTGETTASIEGSTTNLRINQTLNDTTPITITITVTLVDAEEEDTELVFADYEAVAGAEITFDIEFSVPEFNLQSANIVE